jgi:hypothetical protein
MRELSIIREYDCFPRKNTSDFLNTNNSLPDNALYADMLSDSGHNKQISNYFSRSKVFFKLCVSNASGCGLYMGIRMTHRLSLTGVSVWVFGL